MAAADTVHVSTDINRLRKVLVHEPGLEWDLVPCGPSVLERYLTEDIFVLPRAREEHEYLTRILKLFLGDKNVIEFEDLLEEVLSDPNTRAETIGAVSALDSLGVRANPMLLSLPPKALARALIRGAIIPDPDPNPIPDRNLFPPIPNLLFTRDLGVAIPGGFIICHATKPARRRETLLMRYVLRHRLFKDVPIFDVRSKHNAVFWHDVLWHDVPEKGLVSIEGGDIVILDDKTLMVGTGERTTEAAFYLLLDLLRESDSPIEMVIRTILPQARASMHLDTVFTVISKSQFMAYVPVVNSCEYQVFHRPFDRDVRTCSLNEAMKEARLAQVELLSCGGQSRLLQSREQWTDGANLFAIAPQILLGYDRNPGTEKALKGAKRPYRYLQATTKNDFKQIEKIADAFNKGNGVGPIMIGIPGAELSRARGGARCMTMPLLRDD